MRRFVLFALLTSIACSDPAAPSVEMIAGIYSATVFESTENGTRTDLLAAGGSLDIALLPSGAVNGQLNLPGGGTGGSALKVNVGGTWQVRGDEVRLDLRPSLFLDELRFTASDHLLSSEQTVASGIRYQLRLVQAAS